MAKCTYSFELAVSDADMRDYFALRREIFCAEQGLFEQDDRDAVDRRAYPIVAIAHQESLLIPDLLDTLHTVLSLSTQFSKAFNAAKKMKTSS